MFNWNRFLDTYTAVFWDFDGVIKDSVRVKEDAFIDLFEPTTREQEIAIRMHHRSNGGLSRFKKFPIYSEIVGNTSFDPEVYDRSFSRRCVEEVVKSPGISGVENILSGVRTNYWAVISATPETEIKHIIKELSLQACFDDVKGSPKSKVENCVELFRNNEFDKSGKYLVLGDARSDLEMALSIKADFIYVSNYPEQNVKEQSKYVIGDFLASLENR